MPDTRIPMPPSLQKPSFLSGLRDKVGTTLEALRQKFQLPPELPQPLESARRMFQSSPVSPLPASTPMPTPTPRWKVREVLNKQTGQFERVPVDQGMPPEIKGMTSVPPPTATPTPTPQPFPTPTLTPNAQKYAEPKWKTLVTQYFPNDQINNTLNVMFKESSAVETKTHFNEKDKTTDYGLMQINSIHAPEIMETFGYTMEDLFDPVKNLEVASWLYKRQGWQPWYATAKSLGLVQ